MYVYTRKVKNKCYSYQLKLDGTKGVILGHKSKKDGQYSGQKKKNKRTNNILQNTT